MSNAQDEELSPYKKILLVGYPGSGKTSQIWTLPGRKFAYIFDPHALTGLKGLDLEYEKFCPDLEDIDIKVKSLKAGVGDKDDRRKEPKTYVRWEEAFEEKVASGFFNDFDWIIFDSFTTWAETIMDRVTWLNGHLGKQPEQADWAAQMYTIQNAWRVLTSLNLNILCTSHMEMRQDERTKKTYNQLMMTGRLRTRLPMLFSEVLICHANSDAEHSEWLMQTRADKENPVVRTTLQDLEFYEDVTIKDFKRAQDFGLGALLKTSGWIPQREPSLKAGKKKAITSNRSK